MTGNAETLARRAYDRALNQGWSTRLLNLSEVKPADLMEESLALFVVSTWGDGEPPADACDFHYDLEKSGAPALPHLRFAVLGLGDKDYQDFNAFARQLDERLASLGARRLHERIEADLDFDDTYAEWENRVFPLLDDARRAALATASAADASCETTNAAHAWSASPHASRGAAPASVLPAQLHRSG